MPFERTFYRKKNLIFLLPSYLFRAKLLVFYGLFLGVSSLLSAQQINDNQCENYPGVGSGGLDLTNEVGCTSLTVKVRNNQNGSTKSRYIYDYRGGDPNGLSYKPDTTKSFTYTKPGLYIIMQLSESSLGQPQRACRRVTVQDPTPPTFKVLPCPNGKVTLTITNHDITEYEEYVIDWGDGGNTTVINRLNLTTQYQYNNLSPKKITVRGRHSVSKCGGASERTIALEVSTQPATVSKLEILDAVTAELTINNPNLFDLELYRQNGAGQYQTTGKTFKNADEKVKVLIDTTKIFCYKLKPRDSCIASLESNVLCVSFLKVIPDVEFNTVVVSPYRYPSDITKMVVLKNNANWWNPNFTDLFRNDSEAECSKKNCYRLQLTTQTGTVLSNIVCEDPPPGLCVTLANVYVPDAFTPNGDGVNDFFEVKGETSSSVDILIYDRWGAPIFQNTANVRHWNGAVNGQPAPAGPYSYRISVTDKIGRNFIKRGTFVLLR
jgi:gliding motility-associated-like protein